MGRKMFCVPANRYFEDENKNKTRIKIFILYQIFFQQEA